MKHFSTALTNIRRTPYQSIAAILILSVTFFVGYTFSLFVYSTQEILKFFETQPQVIAFFDIDASAKQIQNASDQMKDKQYVADVTTISKDKALEIYQETNKEDPLLLELVTAEILPASIEVSGIDVEALGQIKQDLDELPGIEEVIFQENIIDSLKSWTQTVRYIGVTAVGVLTFTSFLMIAVIISMKISAKRNTINIMHVIGASRWYIKAPYIYEAFYYGIFGSLIGWGSMYVGLLYVTPWLKSFLGNITLLPIPLDLLLIQLGMGTAIGTFLAIVASAFSVQRVMRK